MIWKEPDELPFVPILSTNNRNPCVPPSFCSISAKQRLVTSKRGWLPACGHIVLAHGRRHDGKQCIQLWGGFLKSRNSLWQFDWGTCQNICILYHCSTGGVVSAGPLSAWGMLGSPQETENHHQQHGILMGVCKALFSGEWPQLRFLRSGLKI